MSAPRWTAVIAGGGLSGLSLAAHLAAAAGFGQRRVLVVDDGFGGPRPAVPRVWGFWSREPGLLGGAVWRTYDRVKVHAGGRERVLPLAPYRYRLVRDDLLRAQVVQRRRPGFEFRRGHVDEIRTVGDTAVTIVDGGPIESDWVFDSVTPTAATPVDAWLAFTGLWVQAKDAFDPDLPTLMDFRTPARGDCRFVYVMPVSPDRALVELAAFVPRRGIIADGPERRAAVETYLDEVLRARYTVAGVESAVLPLRTQPQPRPNGQVVAIGARAGLIKASTGYAYGRIQRHSAALAESLSRFADPYHVPAARLRHRWLDALLLDAFDRDPTQLERAFARLFDRNPVGRILAFLDEDTRIRDEIALMWSMPRLPYLLAAARRGWARFR